MGGGLGRYGLSYTTFGYSDLALAPGSVSFTLTNTGKRAGAEVAQVYVGDPPSVGEPPRQLKGYRKVFLEPGHSERVTVPLDPRSFAYWDDARHGWAWRAASTAFTSAAHRATCRCRAR